jgi:Tol biopolymer transport system component
MERSTLLVAVAAIAAFSAPVEAQLTDRVSVDSSGVQGDGESAHASLSFDGRFVVFRSLASNLVANDTNGLWDIFVHDRLTGVTERVNVDSSGAQAADGDSYMSLARSISDDGRYVVFDSLATNLVPGDVNGEFDVFLHDRATGTTQIVSVSSSGTYGDDRSEESTISADGSCIAFSSRAANLVPGDSNQTWDIFLHVLATGTTEAVSVDPTGKLEGGRSPALSNDGRFVTFNSGGNFVPGDWWNGMADLYLRDRSTGVTELVDVDAAGKAAKNGAIGNSSLSADGRFVAFPCDSENLLGPAFGYSQILVRDRQSGTNTIVSVDSLGAPGNSFSSSPAISADGRFVAFRSSATNLVAGDTNGQYDVFVHDRATGVTSRVSVDSFGIQGNDRSYLSSISGDGTVVAFYSYATNLVPGDSNRLEDVFVHERGPYDATWSNFGAGFPGTGDVPSFMSRIDPVIGTTITLDLGNSWGEYTVGALFVGFEKTTLPTSWGGDLLVVPVIMQLVGLSPWGTSLVGDIPHDESLRGCAIELQVIEVDPGAAKGVSFTRGLELMIGD